MLNSGWLGPQIRQRTHHLIIMESHVQTVFLIKHRALGGLIFSAFGGEHGGGGLFCVGAKTPSPKYKQLFL